MDMSVTVARSGCNARVGARPTRFGRVDGRPDQTSRVRRKYAEESALVIPFASRKKWCPGWESNPHEEKSPEDFKSSASAIPPPGHRGKFPVLQPIESFGTSTHRRLTIDWLLLVYVAGSPAANTSRSRPIL
jgi:hypothetical protein